MKNLRRNGYACQRYNGLVPRQHRCDGGSVMDGPLYPVPTVCYERQDSGQMGIGNPMVSLGRQPVRLHPSHQETYL